MINNIKKLSSAIVILLFVISNVEASNRFNFIPPITDTNFCANLQVTKILTRITNGNRYYDGKITACFYNTANYSVLAVSSVKLGNVNLIQNTQYGGFYTDTTGTLPITNDSLWNVTGANGIPSFTYTATNPMPTYDGDSLLPNSITRSSNLVLSIYGISNATNITLQISDGTNTVTQEIPVNTCNITSRCTSTTTVTVPASTLSALQASTSGALTITIGNINQQYFSFRRVAFTNVLSYRKINLSIL